MVLSSLRLQNYRSYTDRQFQFKPGLNIITGPNASGKTNLLEAILVLARGNSYRAKDQELIQFGKPWARLDGANRSLKLETDPIFKKSFIIDGQSVSRLNQPKTIPVVVFEPNHLALIDGPPDGRRTYLDDLLEQLTPAYGALRRHYRRALSQRNALLKRGLTIAGSQAFPWNVRLSELGGQIARSRQELIERLQSGASQLYEGLAGLPGRVELAYDSQWHHDHYESLLLRKLEAGLETDVMRGFTTAGPHRDDLSVNLNGQPAAATASRGETRSLVLLLKVTELQLLAANRTQPPLLLLDDVFSELDASRRTALTRYLTGYQTFLTTTDAESVTGYNQHAEVIVLG